MVPAVGARRMHGCAQCGVRAALRFAPRHSRVHPRARKGIRRAPIRPTLRVWGRSSARVKPAPGRFFRTTERFWMNLQTRRTLKWKKTGLANGLPAKSPPWPGGNDGWASIVGRQIVVCFASHGEVIEVPSFEAPAVVKRYLGLRTEDGLPDFDTIVLTEGSLDLVEQCLGRSSRLGVRPRPDVSSLVSASAESGSESRSRSL